MKKDMNEATENEQKQRVRMAELQDELTQTIKRIEQLQRGGGGGYGSATRAGVGSGNRRAYGSGNRLNSGSNQRASPYGGGSKGSRTGSNNNAGSGTRKFGY